MAPHGCSVLCMRKKMIAPVFHPMKRQLRGWHKEKVIVLLTSVAAAAQTGPPDSTVPTPSGGVRPGKSGDAGLRDQPPHLWATIWSKMALRRSGATRNKESK